MSRAQSLQMLASLLVAVTIVVVTIAVVTARLGPGTGDDERGGERSQQDDSGRGRGRGGEED